MFQSLFEVQILLIGIGILFQCMAVTTRRRELRVYPQRPETPEGDESHADLATAKVAFHKPVFGPPSSKRDYYEMEKTEPGVAPAQLLRTAKVSYFNDVNVKPPTSKH